MEDFLLRDHFNKVNAFGKWRYIYCNEMITFIKYLMGHTLNFFSVYVTNSYGNK